MSPATASICAVTRSAGSASDRLDPLRALRRDGRDRARAVDAERGERLQVGLNAGAAARVAARNCQRGTHTLRSAVMYPTLLDTVTTRSGRALRASPNSIGAVAVRDHADRRRGADQHPAAIYAGAVHVPADGRAARRRGARAAARHGEPDSLPRARHSPALPVFAASPMLPQGAARLLGPTGGYLMAYPLRRVRRRLARRARFRSPLPHRGRGDDLRARGRVRRRRAVADDRAKPSLGLSGALAAGFMPFIIPDLLKLLAAAAVMPAVWRFTGSASR